MRWCTISSTVRSLPWSFTAICTLACHSSFHTGDWPMSTLDEVSCMLV